MKSGTPDLRQARVVVVGAGVFGLAIALTLRRAGAAVEVIDAMEPRDNASGIAAGMLAPAFEAVLDLQGRGRFPLLKEARDLWPQFIETLSPTGFERCGARLIAGDEVLDRARRALSGEGASYDAGPGYLHTPEDWRIEPRMALDAMTAGALGPEGATLRARVLTAGHDRVTLHDGRTLGADAVVLACGFGGLDLAPELSALTPVKGQILRFPGAPLSTGPILRGEGGYVVPGADGPAAGATMQEGASDRLVDPEVTRRLGAQAVRLVPSLAGVAPAAYAAVRPSTPDGLPIVGRSSTGVWLATGARRNGWLLAPLAARLIAAGVGGEAGDDRFTPSRFSRRS